MSHNTSDSAFDRAMRSICERIGSPNSLKLSEAISTSTFVKIDFDYPCIPATRFSEEYMMSKVLSKWQGWKHNVPRDLAKVAIDSWSEIEINNQNVNKRLENFMRGSGFPGTDLITIISMAQRQISNVLGRFDIAKVLNGCRWGPGATFDHRRGTKRDTKMTRSLSTTEAALPYMKLIIEHDPHWLEAITGCFPEGPVSLLKSNFTLTNCSRFSTVPKTSLTNRVIDIQPTANSYLQQGVGQYLRDRLKRFGIDLNSQEYNQNAARDGLSRGWATVDLQNASDSIALSLCTLLLPSDWMQFLTKLRTPFTKLPDGTLHKLQKISAMGNGFTFELETIVFWAITRAVCEFENLPQDEVLVYGDDIIVPQKGKDMLIYVFDYFGFTINTSKSFFDGDFRESCGRHYFRGVDVTPVYQKSLINSPEECIRFYNRICRWSERTYADPFYFSEALSHIIFEFLSYQGFRHGYDKLPKIPVGNVSDDGFLMPLSEFEIDCNGGCFTTVYRRSRQQAPGRRNEAAYLALKMRTRASNMNSAKTGHVFEDTGSGRYRLNKAYIYEATRPHSLFGG